MAPRSSVFLLDQATSGALTKALKRYRRTGLSYEAMARFLNDELGIDVASTTVRNWCRQIGLETDRQAS